MLELEVSKMTPNLIWLNYWQTTDKGQRRLTGGFYNLKSLYMIYQDAETGQPMFIFESADGSRECILREDTWHHTIDDLRRYGVIF